MFEVGAVKIECIKSDECSCKTNTQQEISLWPMPRQVCYVHTTNKKTELFVITVIHELNN